MATKAESKSQATREKILHSASELFLAGGLPALSVRAIAKRAGLSTIGIYSHFDGKQGILDALYIEGFEQVTAAMQMEPGSITKEELVLATSNAYLDVAQKYSAHYRLIFGEVDATYTPSPAATAVAASAFKALLDLSAQFLPANSSDKKIQSRAIETWAILHGYVGIQNHSVAGQIEIDDWRGLALKTVSKSVLND